MIMGAPNSTQPKSHLSASSEVERKLEARHIEFVFEPNLRVDAIRDAEGNQVRLSEHRAPKEMVDRYAEQMKAGANFPAIVVNDRWELVDGNTRRLAMLKNGQNVIPAYICSDLSALEARSLSVELNQSHGLSLTKQEVHAFVASAVQEGQVLDTHAYARMTGTKASTLSRWVAAKHFRMRAEQEGISAASITALSASAQAALQAARLKAVFVELTALAISAKVPAAQLKTIIASANSAASEKEALSIVAEARETRADDAKAIAAGFKAAKRRSAGSALHIGGLLKFEVEDLLDIAPEKQHDVFMRLSVLQERLQSVIEQARWTWNLDVPDPGLVERAGVS
jgi:ParB-like chromosome segregation protein Spo0J